MDTAVDLTTGIWVEVVAIVWVGAVGVGLVGVDNYPNLTSSLGKYGPSSLVTHLGSCGLSGCGRCVGAWLWLDLLRLGLGLGPGFETKPTL